MQYAIYALTSFLLVCFSIPSIIRVAKLKKLHDEPFSERKKHKVDTPVLGGVAIFGCFLLCTLLFASPEFLNSSRPLLLGMTLLFFVGIKDDMINLVSYKKLIAQFLAASLFCYSETSSLVFLSDFFPSPLVFLLLMFFITGYVNAFNFIDGLDGLAASTGLISAITFALIFAQYNADLAMISAILSGCYLGFLYFNWAPAKIFMGDSGSLTSGFCLAYLGIGFLSLTNTPLSATERVILLNAIFVLPTYDLLRVIIVRLKNNIHPFKPDRNHLHHKLDSLLENHAKTTLSLNLAHLSTILTIYSLLKLWSSPLSLSILVVFLIFTFVVFLSFIFVFSHFMKTKFHTIEVSAK